MWVILRHTLMVTVSAGNDHGQSHRGPGLDTYTVLSLSDTISGSLQQKYTTTWVEKIST